MGLGSQCWDFAVGERDRAQLQVQQGQGELVAEDEGGAVGGK